MQRHKNKLHFTISKAITDVMIKKKEEPCRELNLSLSNFNQTCYSADLGQVCLTRHTVLM
jgi:hypothetical protein